jgi:hypothetical protein
MAVRSRGVSNLILKREFPLSSKLMLGTACPIPSLQAGSMRFYALLLGLHSTIIGGWNEGAKSK